MKSVNGLAGLLLSQGDDAGAECLLRTTLASREWLLGPEHPDTLKSVCNLARLLLDQGDIAGAKPLFRRALEGLLNVSAKTGRPHPILCVTMRNYAGCLEKEGHSRKGVKNRLYTVMRPLEINLGGKGRSEAAGLSPGLFAVIEQVTLDPSRLHRIAARLQREDPDLFMELVPWIQSQQIFESEQTKPQCDRTSALRKKKKPWWKFW